MTLERVFAWVLTTFAGALLGAAAGAACCGWPRAALALASAGIIYAAAAAHYWSEVRR